jgi:hypothetical protein
VWGGGGDRLGPVGGRIVAEALIGSMRADAPSYLSREPDWEPTLPAAGPGLPSGRSDHIAGRWSRAAG